MKNKIFVIIFAIILSLPNFCLAVDGILVNDNQKSLIENNVSGQYKQPISKRKIAKKFLAAMAGVTISSFVIFLLLSIYNKARDVYLDQSKIFDNETSLESPDDFDKAIKIFLEKTSWK